ncbi:restriction endonuclease subunit S [Neobacillus ginsengisoli]|uniref:Type I restriction enzyme S subunit n=1 Tax=Neobacillus ginsengisoli TaxID=904295 RepID=A0ABT9Y4X5_9BACI|nr:restriction endonuclease subunit S [Neobacillus ginsengisoli]MDQ0202184.1 type I restriction enzyme S subunit [Neobacillus ginsengisoli]
MSKKSKTNDQLLVEAKVLEEEQPYEVPRNWRWVKLGSVVDVKRGASPRPKGDPKYFGGDIPWLKISDVTKQGQYIYETEDTVTEAGREKSVYVEPNTLILSISASVGRPCINKIGVCIHDGFVKLTEDNRFIDKHYLYHYLVSALNQMLSKAKGAAQVNINSSIVKELPISLPPIKEQTRIAMKVECLLNKIEEAKQLIEDARETFELRRAAILDKAFRGELTRKWRERNTVSLTAMEWMKDIDSLKVGTKTKYKDQLDTSILDNLYQLPKDWEWVRLNDLMESSTYGTSAKTNDDASGTPVIRMGNIVDGYFDLNDLKYLPLDHPDVLKYVLQTHDLLFNRTNSYELVGKTAVIPEAVAKSFTFASYLIRVRLFYKEILADYVSHYINSHLGRRILLSMVSQQVGQANINSQKLASLPIPLPPKEEAIEIVKLLNNYRELESKQKEMLVMEENFDALRQSILYKAFRGELGTNDSGEEDANVLLKEVLQEQLN